MMARGQPKERRRHGTYYNSNLFLFSHNKQSQTIIMVKIEEIKDDPMEMFLGSELIRDANGNTKLSTTLALQGKKLVLLYFSASWCVVWR